MTNAEAIELHGLRTTLRKKIDLLLGEINEHTDRGRT
jgi:hypothetical protein